MSVVPHSPIADRSSLSHRQPSGSFLTLPPPAIRAWSRGTKKGKIMAGVSMEKFEEYFQKADVDRDGRISGAEAVAFLQIWMHADQNRIGFLSRPEFYNALGLVTVSQSKQELKPDIVKAALYGHASAKITPPLPNKCICYTWATAKSSSCFTFDTGGCNFPAIFSKSRGPAPPSSSINQQPGTVLSTSGMHQQLQPVPSSTGMNQQFGMVPSSLGVNQQLLQAQPPNSMNQQFGQVLLLPKTNLLLHFIGYHHGSYLW